MLPRLYGYNDGYIVVNHILTLNLQNIILKTFIWQIHNNRFYKKTSNLTATRQTDKNEPFLRSRLSHFLVRDCYIRPFSPGRSEFALEYHGTSIHD